MNQEHINCTTINSNNNSSFLAVEDLFGFLNCPTEIECMIGGFSIDRLSPGSTHTAITSALNVLCPKCENLNIHDVTSKMIRDFIDKSLSQKFSYRGVITIDGLKRSIEYGKDVPCIFQFLADYFETHILVYRQNKIEAYYSGETGDKYRKVIVLHEIVKDNEVAICYQNDTKKRIFETHEVAHLLEKSSTPSLKYKCEKKGIEVNRAKVADVYKVIPDEQLKKMVGNANLGSSEIPTSISDIIPIDQINPKEQHIDDPSPSAKTATLMFSESTLRKMSKKDLHMVALELNIDPTEDKKSGKGRKYRVKADIVNDIINQSV